MDNRGRRYNVKVRATPPLQLECTRLSRKDNPERAFSRYQSMTAGSLNSRNISSLSLSLPRKPRTDESINVRSPPRSFSLSLSPPSSSSLLSHSLVVALASFYERCYGDSAVLIFTYIITYVMRAVGGFLSRRSRPNGHSRRDIAYSWSR